MADRRTQPAQPPLQVWLFGGARFAAGGRPFRFSARPKALPLLARLLLVGEPLRRDEVAFTLWPDLPEENARTNLRRHLNHIAVALPSRDPPWIFADSGALRWNGGADAWIDVCEFERLVATPHGRDAAVELYTGDLLQELDDEWLAARRDHLRSIFVDALAALVVEARGRNDAATSARFAQRILDADPWREGAVRTLMALRAESGDRAGALAVYESFRSRLYDELGVEPMPDTIGLHAAIERNAALPTIPSVGADVGTDAGGAPFVGRQAEMDALRAASDRAASGTGSLVFVGGEAGIGKSRLVAEFALLAETRGARVLWGTTTSPESRPYQPLAEALRVALPLVEALALPPTTIALLARLLPELAARQAIPLLAELDAHEARARLFTTLTTTFAALAVGRPLVVVLEDLHWAGAATIALAEAVAVELQHLRVLIVATHRDHELSADHPLVAARRRLLEGGHASQFALDRLGVDAVAKILATIPALADTGRASAADIHAASEGNPLFAIELMRDALEAEPGEHPVPLPSRLAETIASRVVRLSEDARFVLDVASVIGPAFDLDTIRNVTGWSEAQIGAATDELIERHVVREAGRQSRFDLAFTHHLIAATVYAGIEPGATVRWHRRTAHAAERVYRDRLDEVAQFVAGHYERGGEAEQAARHYLRAAQAALSLYAYDDAQALARRGLALTPSAQIARDLTLLCETASDRIGDRESQRRALQSLAEMAQTTDDTAVVCTILQRRIAFHQRVADQKLEAELISELERVAIDAGNVEWQAAALEARAEFRQNAGDRDAARSLAARAVELYEAIGNPRGLFGALTLQAGLAAYLGDHAEGKRCVERAKQILGPSADPTQALRLLGCEMAVAFYAQDYGREARAATELLALATTVGDRSAQSSAHHALGIALYRFGEIGSAREHLAAGIDICRATGWLRRLGSMLSSLAALEIEAGRLALAERLVDDLEDTAHNVGDWPLGDALVLSNRAEIALARGDVVEMLAHTSDYLDLAPTVLKAKALVVGQFLYGRALRRLGHSAEAFAALVECRRGVREFGMPRDEVNVVAELALATLSERGPTEALARAEEALALIEGKHVSMFATVRALWFSAQVCRVAGDDDRADQLLRRAYERRQATIHQYPDEESQNACAALAINVEVNAAFERGVWPTLPAPQPARREAPATRH